MNYPRVGLRHVLPVLAVILFGNPLGASPHDGERTDAIPGARPAPFPVRGTATVALRYPTFRLDGTTEVSLVNTHPDKTVVAWKLDYERNGFRSPSLVRDGYPALLGRNPMWSVPADGVLVEPGGEIRLEVPFAVKADLAAGHSVGLVLDVVVFDDLSVEGDAAEARPIFAARAASLAEYDRWLPRIRAAARAASTAGPAIRELERLAAQIEAAPGSRASSLRTGVRDTIRQIRAAPEHTVPILEEYVRHVEATTAVVRDSTPRAFRRRATDPGLKRRVGSSGFWECGSISTSRTVHSSPCGTSKNDWTHDENWNFVCENPIHQGSGSVNAFGACYLGLECPPVLVGPDQWETGSGAVRWNRGWENWRIVVGPFSRRCDKINSDALIFECPCEWVDDPTPPTESGPEGGDAPAPGDGTCTYACGTPILVDLDRGGFDLTDLDGGVLFDLDADSTVERISWTAAGSGDAFLALDRDGNGTIDGGHELFGDATEQPPSDAPHGYHALAVFDDPGAGGDGDGLITAGDAVFGSLRLWTDGNGDGSSQPGELRGLTEAGVEAIDLDFRESRGKDRHGNELRYRSLVRLVRGTTQSVDVIFLTEDP